jgi:hypothetical protein
MTPTSSWNSDLASYLGRIHDIPDSESVHVDSAEKVHQEGKEMDEDERRVSVSFTDVELFAISEFFNSEEGDLPEFLYARIGKKLLVAAAKAGLYDEVL